MVLLLLGDDQLTVLPNEINELRLQILSEIGFQILQKERKSNYFVYFTYLLLLTENNYAGHLTECGGADPHNSPTSAFSASLGHFSA